MLWSKRAIHPGFGVELIGLQVGGGLLSAAARAQLLDEVAQAGVVVLRDHHLTGEALAAFTASLGAATPNATTTGADGGVFRLSNLGADGEILPADHEMIQLNIANQFWHTDKTFTRPRASISMLYGRIIPPVGGQTEFCDTRRAYERLPPARREVLSRLTAFHSVIHSRKLTGFNAWTEAQLKLYGEPLERPVVQLHRESGRMALCLASYIARFSGMDEADSAKLLAALIDHATALGEVYRHEWRPGDLLIWDDRCTMHRALPYDDRIHKREMLAPPRILDPADLPDAVELAAGAA